MADFLGGLLSGGGGLYDDLLTPQQQSQLSGRGLLAMAGAFADAGMPSRLPIPLGAAIGKAAAAMGTGRDQAALQVLQAQKLAQEVQTQKIQAALQQQMFEDFKSMPLAEFLKRHAGAAGSGVASTAAPTIPGSGATAPVPAGSATQLDDPGVIRLDDPGPGAAPSITQYGMPPRQNLSPFTGLRPFGTPVPAGGVMGTAPPLPPGDAPPPDAPGSGASLGDRYGGVLAMAGRLGAPALGASYGGGAGTLPFGGPGQGGEIPGAGGDDEVGSGGGSGGNWETAHNNLGGMRIPGVNATPTQGGFQSFSTPEQGLAAISRQLDRYASGATTGRPLTTIKDIVSTWAPPSENPTETLIQRAERVMGVGRNVPLDLSNPATKAKLIEATIRNEQGDRLPVDPSLISKVAGASPDQYIPSGPASSLPITRAQYSGGLPGGGSGGGAAPGASGGAPATAAAGGDGQGMNTLLLELARRNAMAEILKLGNPYSSMLNVLQGSPEYKGQIAGAEAGARYPFDTGLATWKAALDAANEEKKQKLTTLNTLTKVTVPDGKGGVVEVDATVAQAIDIAHGLPVPELGFKGMFGPGGTGATGGPVGRPYVGELDKPVNVPGVGLVTPSKVGAPPLPGAPPGPSAAPGAQSGVLVPTISEAQRMVLDKNLAATQDRLKGYHDEGQAAAEQVANAGSIGDLLGRVRMGWSANTRQEGARLLAGLGVSQDSIQQFLGTDPSAGDALNKLFLQFSAGAVRNMGAREPGSVISLFAKAYPNLETMPHAAELMNNALRMQAQWKADRTNAAEQHALDQQRGMGQFGENYKGMLGFEQKFGQSNDPRHYWQAAAAMSNEPDIAWAGASAADKQRIYDLIPPGNTYRAGDGKLYRKPVQ